MANLIPTTTSFTLTPSGGAMDSFVAEVPDADTPLALACAALAAGEYAAFAAPELNYIGSTVDPLYGIQWCNRWFYDHDARKGFLWGKNASGQGTWRHFQIYDEQTDAWATAYFQNPAGELGHVYESIALDPSRLEMYSADQSDLSIIKRWASGTAVDVWERPAADYVAAFAALQTSLCWHPNLYGAGQGGILAGAESSASSGTAKLVAWLRDPGSDNPGTWEDMPGTAETGVGTSYQGQGSMCYVRALDAVIYVSRPSLKTFSVPAGSAGSLGTATELGAAPIRCTWVGEGPAPVGVLVDDPVGTGGPYILEKNIPAGAGTNRVWRLVAGAWVEVGTHPFPRGGIATDGEAPNWVVAPLYPYGVFWCISRATLGNQSYLWKPEI